jgi:hypothetical protein
LKSNNLAPVLVFTYNRVEHFKKTIQSLQRAKLSNETTLVIISDGPRNETDRGNVEQIRQFSKTISGFKKMIFEFNDTNKGALWNLNYYEHKYLESHNEIIFMEDDNIIHSETLVFLNEALVNYENDPSIFSISAYSIPINIKTKKDNYFLPWYVPWVCATWKDKFMNFDWDKNLFLENLKLKNSKKKMKNYGHFFYESAYLDSRGYNSALDAKINMYLFNNNMVSICPSKSLVLNIGNDGSGENAGKSNKFNTDIDFEIDQPFEFEKFTQLDYEILKAQKLFLDETLVNRIFLRRIYYFLGFYFPLIKRLIRKYHKN